MLKKFKRLKELLSSKKIKRFFMDVGVFSTVLGIISAVLSIIQFLTPNKDDSIALENYQKGIIYFEDKNIKEAEEFFEKAYSINNDLLDIKYYYAITEFYLDNDEMSYQILNENRYSLNEDELAFYARYKCDKGDYNNCKEYLNKIQKPEKLRNPALCQYIITSLNMAALEGYDALCNTVYLNTILLNRVINQNQDLIKDIKIDFICGDINIEQEEIDTMERRMSLEAEDEITMLKMYKLCMYMYFSHNAIQDKDELPVFIFAEASESIDYLNYGDLTVQFLDLLGYYTIQLDMAKKYPEEIKYAYNNIVKKYDELLKESVAVPGSTKEAFKVIKNMSEDLNNNRFDSNNYNYIFPDGKEYEYLSPKEFVEMWDKLIYNEEVNRN